MADCGYFEELISAQLDGELTEREEEALRAHLETCESCRAYRDALRAVAGAEADLPAPPAELTGRIMDAVRREAAPKKTAKIVPFSRYVRTAALAAAAALVIWAGFRVVSPKGATSAAPQAAVSMAADTGAAAAAGSKADGAAPEEVVSTTAAAEELYDAAVPAENTSVTAAEPETPAAGGATNGLFAAAAAPAPTSEPAADPAKEAAESEEQAMNAAAAQVVLTRADGETLFTGSPEEESLRALLTADRSAPIPEREPDYVLFLTAWGGTEVWYLWEEDGAMLCQQDGADAAGRTVGVRAFRDMFGVGE